MKRWLPRGVTRFKDRHGTWRYRFRRKGHATHYFKHLPGTDEFLAELRACEDGIAAPAIDVGAGRAEAGTFDDLLIRYYRAAEFLDLSDGAKRAYRGVLERWRNRERKGRRYGSLPVRHLQARHVGEMLAELLPHRSAANTLRKRLNGLLKFAQRIGMASTNPIAASRAFKVDGDGWHSWTEDEIAAYEAKHARGTTARLALDLMLWTGQRRGDARLLGPANVNGPRLQLTQNKTGKTVSLPIMPALAESILAADAAGKTFILTEFGKTFSDAGFGNRMRKWCDEAGLPQCSAHGLRKAAARRFAEAGCSNQEIKAWTGHTTDFEVARYTAAADQRALSNAAGDKLLANLAKKVANTAPKPMQKGENK